MSAGWIKLHRKINDWEWLDKPETFQLFIYLLVNANHEDKNWQGITIKRGEIVVGREKLSKLLGVSERSIRTSMTRLKSTNEVTIKTTNKYSVVSIVNYSDYQQNDQQTDQQLTNKRPTTDHKQEYKNIRNILDISNTSKDGGNEWINLLIETFEKSHGFKPTDHKPRNEAWNLLRKMKSALKIYGMDGEEKRIITKYGEWIRRQDWSSGIQKMEVWRLKWPIYESEVKKYMENKNDKTKS